MRASGRGMEIAAENRSAENRSAENRIISSVVVFKA